MLQNEGFQQVYHRISSPWLKKILKFRTLKIIRMKDFLITPVHINFEYIIFWSQRKNYHENIMIILITRAQKSYHENIRFIMNIRKLRAIERRSRIDVVLFFLGLLKVQMAQKKKTIFIR